MSQAKHQELPEASSIKQWEAWRAKELPEAEQIAANVWCLPVLIPEHPMMFTFVYALKGDNDEVVLIDTGWPDERSWQSLQDQSAKAGIDLSKITGIIITHHHPDHHGLSQRVKELSGAWVAMHELDAASLQEHFANIEHDATTMPESVTGLRADRLSEAGAPNDVVADLLTISASVDGMFLERNHPDVILQDGDKVALAGRNVSIVWTPGHTAGNICIYDGDNNILFAGDHILPRISPNIGMHFNTTRKPLQDYLASLTKVEVFDGAHVAPAHEYRFDTLKTRVDQIRQHHEERLEEILRVIKTGLGDTQWQISANLSWSRGWDSITGIMKFAALGEVAAHLEVLEDRGLITSQSNAAGARLYSV